MTARLAELRAGFEDRPWRWVANVAAPLWLLVMVAVVMAPWWQRLDTYGFHDWDVITSFRYLPKVTLLDYGEFPGYNPYACGGYPLWGYVEGATNVVSPWLPAYLWLPLPVAVRVEVTGMALLGAFGAYLLGRHFTRSRAAALLVAALWAVNGRWSLQIAAGHAWHLSYALMPWALWFYERWRQPDARLRELCGLSGSLAWMVYAGGIYPLPHTLLVLGMYALFLSVAHGRLRPLTSLAIAGVVSLGLAAPKLLPVLSTMSSDPRLIDSTERLDLGAFFTLLTDPDQAFGSRPAAVRPYGWHEWGMYISSSGLGLIALGLLLLRRGPARLLAVAGFVLLVLGFGAFHPAAPWTLLHAHVPLFQSQHVPSRFLYPALLLLTLGAAVGLGRVIEKWRRRAPWLDVCALGFVALVAMDVAHVAELPMEQSMWMEAPAIPSGRSFHHEVNPPYQYRRRDWAGPMLLSMMANTGVLNCYGVPQRPGEPPAPLPRGHRDYRGEAYVVGQGSVQLVERTPNRIDLMVSDAAPATMVVINMQQRPGWWVSQAGIERPAQAHERLLAAPAQDGRVSFHYRPPGLCWGIVWLLLTVAGLTRYAWVRRAASTGAIS